jgi:hypothetical protein
MKSEGTATAVVWQERVAEWRASGETAEEFARGRGYAATTLRWWSSRLRRETLVPPGFVRLVPRAALPAEPASALVVEVGDARIRVTRGFDPALSARVVAALRGEVGP